MAMNAMVCQLCTWSGHSSRLGSHLVSKHSNYINDSFSHNYGSDKDSDLPFLNKDMSFTLCFNCNTYHKTVRGNIPSNPAKKHLTVCSPEKQRAAIQRFMMLKSKEQYKKSIKDISGAIITAVTEQVNQQINEIVEHTCERKDCLSEIAHLKYEKQKQMIELSDMDKQVVEKLKKMPLDQREELLKQYPIKEKILLYRQLLPVNLISDLNKLEVSDLD